MAVILTLGIVSLHFTGMAAFGVYPLLIDGTFANAAAMISSERAGSWSMPSAAISV